jgi:hypothetical protein
MTGRPTGTSSPTPDKVPNEGDVDSAAVKSFGWHDAAAIGAIVALWGISAIIVNPVGDFPLIDDWAYGLPVKWLIETGHLRFTDWQQVTLVTQTLLAAPFVGIMGFSFTLLRVWTLAMGAIGLAACYLAGREFGLSRRLSMAIAALYVINPIFIALSESFMTDVPFWTLLMVAVFLLLRGVGRGQAVSFWAGWIAVLAATLLRQLALAIPIGLVVGLALKEGFGRTWLVRAVVPALILCAVVAAYPRLLAATIGRPAAYYYYADKLKLVFDDLMHLKLGAIKPVLRSFGCALMHLGLWMLPLLVLLQPSPGAAGRPRRKTLLTYCFATVFALVVTSVLWAAGTMMPTREIGGCVLVDIGTGPRNASGQSPHAPPVFWAAITAAAAFGALLLLLSLASIARRKIAEVFATRSLSSLWPSLFLLTAGAFYMIPLCSYANFYERHVLLEMALLGLPVAAVATTSASTGLWKSPARLLCAAVLALLYLGFGVVSSHDYLAWNRSRWEAGRSLMADHRISPTEINGGFEFNAYFYWRGRRDAVSAVGPNPEESEIDSLIAGPRSSYPRRFIISFSELPGFERVYRVAVDRWLPLSPSEMLILKRSAEPPVPVDNQRPWWSR